MASVQSKFTLKYGSCGLGEDEAPEHQESAGEILIKELVQKQTNTKLTLEQQLCQEKKFERGVGVISLDEIAAGTNSLKQFETRRKIVEAISELEGRGISKSEALVWLSSSRQSKATIEAQEAYQQTITNIYDKPSSSNNVIPLKRRDLELALSVKPDSLETRLYQFAVKNESIKPKIEYESPDHPIHQLPKMAQNLDKTCDILRLTKTIRRKRRQQLEALAEPQGPHFKQPCIGESLWDVIEKPMIKQGIPKKDTKIVTCKKETLYTIKDGKIVQIENKAKTIGNYSENDSGDKPSDTSFIALQNSSKSEDITVKLSEEEIKQLARFKNYERGLISKTLFIKNLSKTVTKTDLIAIFQKFESTYENNIIYNLMSGKMKGQAFIHFPSCEKAMEALDKINGTIFKGKPIIIQYGKQRE